MFTGIVEAVGEVIDAQVSDAGRRVRVATPPSVALRNGDSIAVNGVCLTAVDCQDGLFVADIGPETTRVTNLRGLVAGHTVNLERPVRLNGRLDGHLVLGHVDGVGSVVDLRQEADAHWLTIRFPTTLARYFVTKGSVAVDGVSLTIATLADDAFAVQIVPYTWAHTTFQRLRTGDLVNLECDMIGKYVVRALELARPRQD